MGESFAKIQIETEVPMYAPNIQSQTLSPSGAMKVKNPGIEALGRLKRIEIPKTTQ